MLQRAGAASGAASSSCSKLSSTSRQYCSPACCAIACYAGLTWLLAQPDRLCDRRGDERGIAQRREISKKNTPPAKRSSASAPTWRASRVLPVRRARQRHQPMRCEQLRQLAQLAFAAYQITDGCVGRFVVNLPPERLEYEGRRKSSRSPSPHS